MIHYITRRLLFLIPTLFGITVVTFIVVNLAPGDPVEVINRVKEGRSLFLVIVGSFANADEAREQGSEIKRKHNVDAIVTTK